MTRNLTVQDREAVIAFEEKHLGMGEQPAGSNRVTPAVWYGMNGSPWCAMFQSWSFYEILGFSPFPASSRKGFAACVSGAQWFRQNGLWASADVTPKRGWLIFFKWPGDSIEHHIGMVLGASRPREVDTIEGNVNDRVSRLHRRSSIAGYGTIPYQGGDSPVPPPPNTSPSDLPVLHLGSKGPHVIVLQTILKTKASANLEADGDFGTKTEVAVKNLQRYFKLPDDGVVGPKTWGVVLFINR